MFQKNQSLIKIFKNMESKLKLFSILIVVFFAFMAFLGSGCASNATPGAGDPTYIAKADSKTGAMFRWWIPAAFVDYAEVDAEFKTIAEKGFKGVELCINMADSDYPKDELKEYGWGTEKWNSLYKYILQKANEYGIQVDVTISPAWPAAVTTITPEDDASTKGLINNSTEIFSGSFNGEIAVPDLSSIRSGPDFDPEFTPEAPLLEVSDELKEPVPNKPVPVAVVAAKITSTDNVTKTVIRQWGDMPYNPAEQTQEVILFDPYNMKVVTDYTYDDATGKYIINWKAPDDGNWKLFGFWMVGSEQENRQGAATYDPCYVVNHFSKAGAEAIISYWNDYLLDDETRDLQRENGGSIFEDSFEVHAKGLFWSADMLEEFKNRRGYDLTPYLPVLIGPYSGAAASYILNTYEFDNGSGKYSDLGDRIRNDFNQVLTDLYIDYHIKPIQAWAQSLGMGYRAQCYSGPFDMTALSAVALGPDAESLGFGDGSLGDDRYRMMVGGAHMANRLLVSSEVGARFNKGYRVTWRDMLEWINKGYVGGSNQMIFHGFPYLNSNSSVWPGYSPFGFGIAGYWGPRQPGWENIEDLADYLARTQYVLQNGMPRMDVAVYHHEYSCAKKMFEDQGMAKAGYTYDIISPNILNLPAAKVRNSVLDPDGPAYKAVIINSLTHMPVETAEKLLEYANNDLKIIIVGQAPSKTSYFNNWEANDKELSEVVAKLLEVETVKIVEQESDVVDALRTMGIRPDAEYQNASELSSVHRVIDGIDYYYLYNYGDQEVNMDVTFRGEGQPYSIDQWSGEIKRIVQYIKGETTITTNIKLVPQETTILAFGPGNILETVETTPSISAESVGYEMELTSGWTLSVESWENANNPENSSETKKTIIDIGQTELKPWKDIEGLGNAVSGIGTYTNTFNIDPISSSIKEVQLELGKVYGCSVLLRVNGIKAYLNQFTNIAEIGSHLNAGENVIVVKVTSTLGNRLISDGTITPPRQDPSVKVEYEDYGLIGPVKLKYIVQGSIKE